ncbi:MAG: TatD family hydrolase [bacterium]
MFDTHAHINFNAFKEDADEVIRRSLLGGVGIINVGSNYDTSKAAIELAEKYPNDIYAAVGLHPIHLAKGVFKMKMDEEEMANDKDEPVDFDKFRELILSSKKVVAVGEIGLDYYYRPKTKTRMEEFKSRQKEALLAQMEIADDLRLPVIFHCRSAHEDLINLLKSSIINHQSSITGVLHCFTGNWEEAQQYLELGLYLGLNGIIDKLDLAETITKMPLDKMLVETDCPYLAPRELGDIRNEPVNVKYVLKKIAQLRKISYEELEEITTDNAKKLFKI